MTKNQKLNDVVGLIHKSEMITVSWLSLVGASLVLLTGILFPDCVRRKTLSFTIMLISFNNWVTCIGAALGYPTGAACVAQGALTM
jgi:hypothetical protein